MKDSAPEQIIDRSRYNKIYADTKALLEKTEHTKIDMVVAMTLAQKVENRTKRNYSTTQDISNQKRARTR